MYQLTSHHLETGRSGETIARGYLEQRGYETIEMNWRCAAGELDLVMTDGPYLVFVEVKARRSSRAGAAEEAITAAKARRLLAAGEWFVSEHPDYQGMVWRIDLVALTIAPDGSVLRRTHLENAISAG